MQLSRLNTDLGGRVDVLTFPNRGEDRSHNLFCLLFLGVLNFYCLLSGSLSAPTNTVDTHWGYLLGYFKLGQESNRM